MLIEVREISANQTLLIRSAILRPGMPLDAVRFPGDELETTVHFGAFAGAQHVGVASIYAAPLPEQPEVAYAWQLRGMATVPEVRGQGAGRALLLAAIAEVRARGGTLLWCNARTGAVEFYRKHGLEVVGEEFDIPEVGPHFRMRIRY
ncbi:GNAT family N-acetyltransferase [Verrucomicrobiota bacterium sgz303538]